MTCPSLETIVAYTLDELEPEAAEAFEAHYFGCDDCMRQAERLERLVAELGSALPPILTEERRRALEATHPRHTVVNVERGATARMRLAADAPVGLWVMHAPLAGVSRVDFEACSADGARLFTLCDVPFDAARGEVVLACQFHYRAIPGVPRLHVHLTATDQTGTRALGEYVLDHFFATA